jgi:transcriptional/translational regulatory protein YebC/TACO1
MIEATPPPSGEDPEDAALEADADDVQTDEAGLSTFITAPESLHAVETALTGRGWTTSSSALVWIPNNPMSLDDAQRAEVEIWLERMDADDDVRNIFVALQG